VTSALAASALSRRFVLGPLIALALVGAPAAQFDGFGLGSAAPTPRASPSTVLSPFAAASRVLLLAHEAEAVYFVDNLVYAATTGDELTLLTEIEPRVKWGTEVIVQLPTEELANSEVVILRAPIMGSGSLCMSEVSEVEDAGTYYARVAGTAKCPPRKPGMPGWIENREAGWGAA
jgi:hypothetical protein